MSKHDSAPTHSWVIASHVNRFVVRISVVLLILLGVLAFHVVSTINEDCTKPVELPGGLFGYDIQLTVAKDPDECSVTSQLIPDFTIYPNE